MATRYYARIAVERMTMPLISALELLTIGLLLIAAVEFERRQD